MLLSRNSGRKGMHISGNDQKYYEYFRGYLSRMDNRAKIPIQKG